MSIVLFSFLIILFCFINSIYAKDTNINNNLETLLDQVNETEQMIKHYNEQHNDATKLFDNNINKFEKLNEEINKRLEKVSYSLDIMIKIVVSIACCSFG